MPYRSQRVAAMAIQGAEHSQGTHDFGFFAVGDVSRSQSQIGHAWADGDGGAAPSRIAPPAFPPQPQMPYHRQRVAAKAIQGAEHSQHPAMAIQHPAAMAMQDSPLHVVPLGTAPDAAKPPPPRRGRGRPKGLISAWRTPSEQPEPTPEELIGFLRSKYGDGKLAADGVKEFNVYEAHPNTIIEKLGTNADKTWYVFSPRRWRNARYDRPWAYRSAGAVGHWRVQKVATPVHGADGEVIGMTSTFAFFLGKTMRESVRTPWKMKEYYITEEHGKPIPNSDDSNKLLDEWVICRVSCTRKKSDAQAGAGPDNMGDQSGEIAGHVDKTNGDSVPWAGHLKNRLLTSDLDASASEDNLPQKDGDQSGEAAGRVNETNAGQDKFADDDEINEWLLQCASTL